MREYALYAEHLLRVAAAERLYAAVLFLKSKIYAVPFLKNPSAQYISLQSLHYNAAYMGENLYL